jgi:hypothetical protein
MKMLNKLYDVLLSLDEFLKKFITLGYFTTPRSKVERNSYTSAAIRIRVKIFNKLKLGNIASHSKHIVSNNFCPNSQNLTFMYNYYDLRS